MTPTTPEPDGSAPGVLEQFEEELLLAPDRRAVLERYGERYPEMRDDLSRLAEALAMILAASPPTAETPGGPRAGGPRPERFGPYRVVRSIGVGGMGEVFEAVEEPLGRRVAVKTLRRRAPGPAALGRFDRERRTLARLHHTNVVPIYATGAEGDLLYFAMPYLAGASLGQVIRTALAHDSTPRGLAGSSFEELLREAHSRNQTPSPEPPAAGPPAPDTDDPTAPTPTPSPTPGGPPAPGAAPPARHHLSRTYLRTAVQVMATVAEGLHHAHEAGVVHRDLKPSNIIVEANGHAWVLDFGLAALKSAPDGLPLASAAPLAAPPADDALTRGPLGTACYMAPEQHADGRLADARSDVWSLGATLYELLTLRRAFADRAAVLRADPTPPRHITPEVDRALEAIVLKALSKDPAARYPTALALADDLHRWLRREPVSAWPTHPAARPLWRAWLWSVRNKGWAAAIALVLLGSLGLGIYAEEQRQRAEEQRQRAVERDQAKARQIRLLDLQRNTQGLRPQGWADSLWRELARVDWKPEDRAVVHALAVTSLTGLDVRRERRLPHYARSLAFAPDGRLWLGRTDRGVMRLDPETVLPDTWPLEVEGPLAIRPDGSPLQLGPTYTEPDDPDRIPLDPRPNPRFPLQLLDVERQAIARTLPDPVEGGSRLRAWTLAPRGSHAAAAVVDPEGCQWLLVWDADAGRLLHRIAVEPSPESPALPDVGLAFSPDAGLLASWDGSGRVHLWSTTDGQSVASFQGRGPIHCAAFGPDLWLRDGPRSAADRWLLALGDADGLVTLWSPGAQGSWPVLRHAGLDVLSLAFSPDGTMLASAGRGAGELWDVATGRHLVSFDSIDYTTALAFSPDGTRLVGSGWAPFAEPDDRASTYFFRLDASRGVRHLHGLSGQVTRAVYSPDGKRVAALSSDWWAGVWERDTGRLLRLLAVPRGQFTDNAALAFSPDGTRLAISAGNTASLWDLETGAARRWSLPWALTEALAFAGPDRLLLMRTEVEDGSRPPDSTAPASRYPRVCVLRDLLGPTPEDPVAVIPDFRWGVQAIEAAPDASCFVIEGRTVPKDPAATRSVRVYSPEGRYLTELPTRWPSKEPSGWMGFDPKGGRLYLETYPDPEPTRALFEMPSGRFLGTVSVSVRGLAPGARLMAGVIVDGGAYPFRLYDRAGHPLVERLAVNPSGIHVAFSPDLDGRYLLWGNPSGYVSVADLVEIRRRLTEIGQGW